MQLKTRTWFLISLVCFLLAGYFWHLGNERWREEERRSRQTNSEPDPGPIRELGANNFRHAPPPLPPSEPDASASTNGTNVARSDPFLTNRLSNTSRPIEELMRIDTAVLLRNAFIDTRLTDPLNIPEHLRAQGDPGSYIVQSRGPLTEAFRARLKSAGATIVSYIPNNAYLVRMSEAGADLMRGYFRTQSVLPWEPYYKLDLRLLAMAVENHPLVEGTPLNVLVFPGQREAGLQSLKEMGAQVIAEDRSPFGHQIMMKAPSGILTALAQSPLVQSIELHHPRQVVNDLTRPRIGVTTNSFSPPPHYLGLTGAGVSVNVNDTGIDATHPDFGMRVSGDTMRATFDYDGHGTHVAGTIAGDGSKSSTVPTTPPGSSTNGYNFRGMAPAATLFAEQIDLLLGPVISDSYLQETAAANTNFISNNSWGYVDSFQYDLAAASYDAAARDALPRQTGPESMLFVFAAGNSGGGGSDGQGGSPDTIGSPATAKNGITVGAIEKARFITNVVVAGTRTNADFYPPTDSDTQVTYFSSRGNVGAGVEGPFGRFKPDLVAPGSFVISCRAENWKDPTDGGGGVILNRIRNEVVKPGKTNAYSILIPANATGLSIIMRSNSLSPDPFPDLPLYAKFGAPPDLIMDQIGVGSTNISPIAAGLWYLAVGNNSGTTVNYDFITVISINNTNAGNYWQVFSNLNYSLGPDGGRHYYRYESGTSQAAPAISGTLALLQEFFQKTLKLNQDENWPALMKAMLINGSRSLAGYTRQVQTSINLQGWGLVNLTNSVPPAMNGGPTTQATWPIAFYHTNSLYTGQSHTRTIALAPFARTAPLRFTLVWTDPPGNPAASLKLVNDLDLIVSNNIPNGDVYYGNNIPQGSDFNVVSDPMDTNAPPVDLVNNVENVFINRPIPGTNYSVIVRAHRVNVNAVTGQTNGVLQDYALVISSGNTLLTNAFTSISDIDVTTQRLDENVPFVSALTNGAPLVHQRVGANNPEVDVLNNGYTNQWNFYVYTNTTTFTNVALLTFLSPNLSRSRFRDADIDLYASFDPSLTNLATNVINDAISNNNVNGSRSARGRTGTELLIYTNTGPGSIFYLGVKSEDQQGGEFDIVAIAFNNAGRDDNGNVRMVFQPLPLDIPDGSPEAPGGTNLFAFVLDPANVRRIVLTNTLTHENGGDLYGIFHNPAAAVTRSAVLNNHRSFTGTQTFIYDDSGEADVPFSQVSDGPGSLRSFVGDPAFGLWQFTIIDNSPFHVGSIDGLMGIIEPDDLTNNLALRLTVCAQHWKYRAFDVPLGVTNVIVSITNQNPALPLDVYLRVNDFPDLSNYDKKGSIDPPGGGLSLSVNESPGLQPGNRYYAGVYNPNNECVTFTFLPIVFQYGLNPIASQTYLSPDTPKALLDDAVTNSIIVVTNNRAVADVRVGLRIDHPRLSDLSIHLVSPQGTRILLTENRGGPLGVLPPDPLAPGTMLTNSYGFGFPATNVIPFSYAGMAQEVRTNIDTGKNEGIVTINYDFFAIPDELRIYYDGNRIFDSGLVSGAGSFSVQFGPGLSTVVTLVMNEGGNPNPITEWGLTATVTGPWNYATFTDDPNLGGPIKFGFPPYYQVRTNRTVLSNSFENVMVGPNPTNFNQYLPPPPFTFENWQVLTNGVAVFSDTNHPWALSYLGTTNWGTNFLALSSGRVSLPLATNVVPDRDYVLTYAQRKVSSSPTQSVDILVGVNADVFLELGPTNRDMGAAGPAQWANKVRLCPGQEVVITAQPEASGDTNTLVHGLPKYGLIGCFSFSPEMLTSNTVAGVPFYVGTNGVIALTNYLAPVNAPRDPGDYYLFLGVNNDNYDVGPTNNLIFYNATVRWQQCQNADGTLFLGANPVPIHGSADWKVETVRFLANPTMTNLTLKPEANTTLLFDWFQINELVPGAFYQSEEPMTPFKGQLALGKWKLEVWDNRAGHVVDTNDTGWLYSWSLRFVFSDSPTSIPLTNGVIYTNTVIRDQIRYFAVAVPNEAIRATNVVFSTGPGTAGVELLYSRDGLPIGQSPPDPLPAFPQGLPLVLTTTVPLGAELPQGTTYYLGVRNVDPAEVNDFQIRAEFNIRVLPLPNDLVGLPNRVIGANSNSFENIRANPGMAVTNMNYYYFDVGSTDIVSASVSVSPFIDSSNPGPQGDVNVVLKRALPVVDLFPTPTRFDYESTQPYYGQELILINSNSLPVQLAPGRWYVGVYNTTNAVAHYDIASVRSTRRVWNYIDLANGVPVQFTNSISETLTNFYRFVVPDTNSAVLFEIYGLVGGDADLLVRRSDLPEPDLYDFSFLQRFDPLTFSPLPELVALRTNIFLPNLSWVYEGEPAHINPTNWFLQVVSPWPNGGTVSGWICAKVVDPVTGLLQDCQTPSLTVSNNFNPGDPFTFTFVSVPGEKYAIEETADLKTWATAKIITATGIKTSFTTPAPRTSPPRFYRIRQTR